MLNGLRVLVVEDDPTIAADISDLIERAEGLVLGPVNSLREAQQLVRSGQFIDAAVLDINLGDGEITPILEVLRSRKVGVVVYTGGSGLPPRVGERHPDVVVLQKPVQPGRMVSEIQRAHRNAAAA